jgi:hypothetical protein
MAQQKRRFLTRAALAHALDAVAAMRASVVQEKVLCDKDVLLDLRRKQSLLEFFFVPSLSW